MTLLEQAYALQQAGRLVEAVIILEYVLREQPDNPDVLCQQANALKSLRRYEEALAVYGRVVALKPDCLDAWLGLGNCFLELHYYVEAIGCYDFILAIHPDYYLACVNRAVALNALERYAEALESSNQALAIHADNVEAHCARAMALCALGYFEAAVNSNQRAISLRADCAEAYANLGSALQMQGNIWQALSSYNQAIAIRPDFANALWNKALLLLLVGDFTEGWALYEWGLQTNQRVIQPLTEKPRWQGQKLQDNQTLLIVTEQGLGDVLQFCRYIPMVQTLGVNVVLEVQPALLSVCSTLAEGLVLVERGQPLPDFDYYCPIMSLPLVFKTTLSTVPGKVPYLSVDRVKQQCWQQRLAGSNAFKVGLVWSGSATHKNDLRRSMNLSQLATLLALPIEFHILQKELRADDEALLTVYPNLYEYRSALMDFSDTAALLSCMDLVITVDTSVAHLAGALGKPVWILLAYMPDFRWLLGCSDSPWYPTATLFRQDVRRAWEPVVADVAAKLVDMRTNDL